MCEDGELVNIEIFLQCRLQADFFDRQEISCIRCYFSSADMRRRMGDIWMDTSPEMYSTGWSSTTGHSSPVGLTDLMLGTAGVPFQNQEGFQPLLFLMVGLADAVWARIGAELCAG